MCGIIGFNFEDKKFLKSALKEIKHRGPDSSGTFTDKGVSLGHNRLSILDLSVAGKQPMSNEDRTIWVIFNGEIYNHAELKKSLKKRHNFKSNTDTEILLHLYEEQGIDMLKRLQGMFAFCIYDSNNKILFIARDRAGIKPLYYYDKQGEFIFCSEIKGILKYSNISKKLNKNALESYLTFRANTNDETFFSDIFKLKPGHYIIYSLKHSQRQIKKYWDVKYSPTNKSEKYYSEKLLNLLDESVKPRLICDVPYGIYLSGGVDSGTILSLMKKNTSERVNSFSVGFEQEEHTETNEAKFLADKIGSNHHELLIKQNSIKKLPEIIHHLDEPMCDPTSIPIYFLSEYAKRYCKVILTGEGADELFAGYPQYKFMKMHHSFISKIPMFMRKPIPKIIKNIPKQILDKGFKFASSLGEKGIERGALFLNSNHPSEQYLNQVAIFNQQEQTGLLNKKINLYSKYNHYFNKNIPIVESCMNLDFKEPMVEDLLMKVDKNTMAHSIEARVPFLDHRIIEFSKKIPTNLKLKGLKKDKYILRKSVNKLIPEKTKKRKKKHFFVPIDNWFNDELSSLKKELLSREHLSKQGIFNYNYIEKINKGFSKSKLFYSRQLWALLTFQIWYNEHFLNKKIKI